jgi:hypothetical protein
MESRFVMKLQKAFPSINLGKLLPRKVAAHAGFALAAVVLVP